MQKGKGIAASDELRKPYQEHVAHEDIAIGSLGHTNASMIAILLFLCLDASSCFEHLPLGRDA